MTSTARRLGAETIGSALLAAVVVGSGIAAERLTGDPGLQLGLNAAATALGLYWIILCFVPLSGAHLNPVISLVDAALGARPWREVPGYLVAQVLGCSLGAILANLMFGLPAVTLATTERVSQGHLLAELVATAGLVLVVFGLVRSQRGALVPAAVACYIGSAYFFTSSTSFANPAITIGRMLSDSFAGISPGSAPWFIAAQLLGGGIGLLAVRWLYRDARDDRTVA